MLLDLAEVLRRQAAVRSASTAVNAAVGWQQGEVIAAAVSPRIDHSAALKDQGGEVAHQVGVLVGVELVEVLLGILGSLRYEVVMSSSDSCTKSAEAFVRGP